MERGEYRGCDGKNHLAFGVRKKVTFGKVSLRLSTSNHIVHGIELTVGNRFSEQE